AMGKKTTHQCAYPEESALLPCYCTDPNTTPKRLLWKKLNTYQNTWDEISSESDQYRNRVQLFRDHSPGNLSLLISHLTEEDGGDYRCLVNSDGYRDIRLTVKVRVVGTETEFSWLMITLQEISLYSYQTPDLKRWRRLQVCLVNSDGYRDIRLTVKVEEQSVYTTLITDTNNVIPLSSGTSTKTYSKPPQSLPFVPFALVTLIFLHIVVAVVYCTKRTKGTYYYMIRPVYSCYRCECTDCCTLEDHRHTKYITAYTGGSVLLPCYCTDLQSRPKTFTWEKLTPSKEISNKSDQYRNRVQLVNDHSPGNLSLLISHLTEKDDGWYRCKVNGGGYRDVRLTVKGCTLTGREQLLTITAHRGGSVLLPCSCTELRTKPETFTWNRYNQNRKDWERIPNESDRYRNRVQLVNDHSPGNLSLLISHLTEEDGGVYRCDGVKSGLTDIRLTVEEPPVPLPFVPYALVTVIILHIVVAVVYCRTKGTLQHPSSLRNTTAPPHSGTLQHPSSLRNTTAPPHSGTLQHLLTQEHYSTPPHSGTLQHPSSLRNTTAPPHSGTLQHLLTQEHYSTSSLRNTTAPPHSGTLQHPSSLRNTTAPPHSGTLQHPTSLRNTTAPPHSGTLQHPSSLRNTTAPSHSGTLRNTTAPLLTQEHYSTSSLRKTTAPPHSGTLQHPSSLRNTTAPLLTQEHYSTPPHSGTLQHPLTQEHYSTPPHSGTLQHLLTQEHYSTPPHSGTLQHLLTQEHYSTPPHSGTLQHPSSLRNTTAPLLTQEHYSTSSLRNTTAPPHSGTLQHPSSLRNTTAPLLTQEHYSTSSLRNTTAPLLTQEHYSTSSLRNTTAPILTQEHYSTPPHSGTLQHLLTQEHYCTSSLRNTTAPSHSGTLQHPSSLRNTTAPILTQEHYSTSSLRNTTAPPHSGTLQHLLTQEH
ncbi:hypothetical protein NFI96_029403, partial [Prochilodus magdalenae]